MAYVKAHIREQVRATVTSVDGILWCGIEKIRKGNGGKYNMVFRLDEEVSLSALTELAKLFKAESLTISGGYEHTGGCEICHSVESYLEIEILGGTVPQDARL